MMSKPVYAWGLPLLALALLSAGSFILFGIRVRLSPWLILAAVGAIFNVLLFVYSRSGPLKAHEELRRTLESIFLQDWFYIGGAFALAGGRYKIAGVAVVGGVIMHLFVTRKHVGRLRRLRASAQSDPSAGPTR